MTPLNPNHKPSPLRSARRHRHNPKAKAKLEQLESSVAFNPEALADSGILDANQEIEALVAKLEKVASERKEAFLVVFQHFAKVLGEHIDKCRQEETELETTWFRITLARFQQTGRKVRRTFA